MTARTDRSAYTYLLATDADGRDHGILLLDGPADLTPELVEEAEDELRGQWYALGYDDRQNVLAQIRCVDGGRLLWREWIAVAGPEA